MNYTCKKVNCKAIITVLLFVLCTMVSVSRVFAYDRVYVYTSGDFSLSGTFIPELSNIKHTYILNVSPRNTSYSSVLIDYDSLADLVFYCNQHGLSTTLAYNSAIGSYLAFVQDKEFKISALKTVSISGCLGNADGSVYVAKREASTAPPDVTVIVPSVPTVNFDDSNIINGLEDIYDRLTLMIECQIEALHDIILNARFVSNLISIVDNDIYPRLLDILSTNSNIYNLLSKFLDSFNSKFSDLDNLFGTDAKAEYRNGDIFTWNNTSRGFTSAVADGSASNIRLTPTTTIPGYNAGWGDDGKFSITPADGGYFPASFDTGYGTVTMPTVTTSATETVTNPDLSPYLPAGYTQYYRFFTPNRMDLGFVPVRGMFLNLQGSIQSSSYKSAPLYVCGANGLYIAQNTPKTGLDIVSGGTTVTHISSFDGSGGSVFDIPFGFRWTLGSDIWVSCRTVKTYTTLTDFPNAPASFTIGGANGMGDHQGVAHCDWRTIRVNDSNGKLLYEFFPCKRDSDGQGGLYRVNYSNGSYVDGQFISGGSNCFVSGDIPKTVEQPVTVDAKFTRIYRDESNVWYAVGTDGSSHGFTIESYAALANAFPIKEYSSFSDMTSLSNGTFRLTWEGSAQTVTINYQVYAKWFSYIANQIEFNRNWWDDRLSRLSVGGFSVDLSKIESLLVNISNKSAVDFSGTVLMDTTALEARLDKLISMYAKVNSVVLDTAAINGGQIKDAVGGELKDVMFWGDTAKVDNTFVSSDGVAYSLNDEKTTVNGLTLRSVNLGSTIPAYIANDPVLYAGVWRKGTDYIISDTYNASTGEYVQRVGRAAFDGLPLVWGLDATSFPDNPYFLATIDVSLIPGCPQGSFLSEIFVFSPLFIGGTWGDVVYGDNYIALGGNESFSCFGVSASATLSTVEQLQSALAGTEFYFIRYGTVLSKSVTSSTIAIPEGDSTICAEHLRITGKYETYDSFTQTADIINAINNLQLSGGVAADLSAVTTRLDTLIANSTAKVENVTNVVIEETNNAYNVFYVTTDDGDKKPVGEVAGDTLSASGKLLNFLYKLCFEGALSRVDDSITNMDGFYFDSGAGLEGNIWD